MVDEVVHAEIGKRVRDAIAVAAPDSSQAQIATEVGMTADALSRALNGRRAFSSIELARLSDLLRTDIHFLITGEPDPRRLVFVARHQYDSDTGQRAVPGRDGDDGILQDIALAYQQVANLPASAGVPASSAEIRAALGTGFIRPFADRVEDRLSVDIVRVSGLSTAYCFTASQRHVIVVPAVGNWFRENWDIAHELGHLAAGHLTNQGATAAQEAAANAFAADLLLPAEEIRAIAWSNIDEASLAGRVWEFGVSTLALANRLASLSVPTNALVQSWANQPTQRLLRWHWIHAADEGSDPITQRMTAAATRRFPLALEEAHLKLIASGDLGKGTLAWMLGVPPETLDVDVPPSPPPTDVDDLALALGLVSSL